MSLQTAENVVVHQISRLLEAAAVVPVSPAGAAYTCLLALERGDSKTRDVSLNWLEKAIRAYPPEPIDASHQLEKCLTAASYYRLSLLAKHTRLLDDSKLIRYVEFARQQNWFDHARMAMEAAMLAGELIFADDAGSYLRDHLRGWRLRNDHLSAMYAYNGLGATLTEEEIEWLIHDARVLDEGEDLQLEIGSLALLALQRVATASAAALAASLARRILSVLGEAEQSMRAVVDLQALLYLASSPISEADFSECVHAVVAASPNPLLQKIVIQDGRLILDLQDAATPFSGLAYLPLEDVALAAYALTACGYGSLVGVSSREATALHSQLRKAASVRPGHFIVPPWEMRVYNASVLVLAIVIVMSWSLWTAGAAVVPKPDWMVVLQGVAVPVGILVLAAMFGWAGRGRALTGLLVWLADMTGHKLEQLDLRVRREHDDRDPLR